MCDYLHLESEGLAQSSCTVSSWTSIQGWKYPIDEKDVDVYPHMSFSLFGEGGREQWVHSYAHVFVQQIFVGLLQMLDTTPGRQSSSDDDK